jgi:hypothetical protein
LFEIVFWENIDFFFCIKSGKWKHGGDDYKKYKKSGGDKSSHKVWNFID